MLAGMGRDIPGMGMLATSFTEGLGVFLAAMGITAPRWVAPPV